MRDTIEERLTEAICAAQDAAEIIEGLKSDIYDEIEDNYELTEEQQNDLGYYVEGLFDFLSVGGMIVSAPGAPEVDDVINFLEGCK